MAGYIGSKAVLLSTTAAVVTGDMTVAGATTLSGAFTSLGIDDNATSTAITIDASENVGIGTATPSVLLDVAGSGAQVFLQNTDATANGSHDVTVTALKAGTGFNNLNIGGYEARFKVGGSQAEAMRIDSSGMVGIGTSSPSYTLDVNGGTNNIVASFTSTDTNSVISFGDNTTAPQSMYLGAAGNDMFFNTNGSERMRIDASGNVFVGKTVNDNTTVGTVVRATGQLSVVNDGFETGIFNRLTSDGANLKFQKDSVLVGSISVTASATAFNMSSDYRLKENVTPIQGAADTVMSMQPCTYTAIADGLWYDGFLAHELQEAHPRAVQGTKDAMKDEEYEITPAVYEDVVTPAVDAVAATYDDEGLELTPAVEAMPETTENTLVTEAVTGTRSVPDMQSVDYSKLTPILTAALQEALTEIAALKVRVAALEVTP